MATIRKRGNKWRVEIYKNGVRKSKLAQQKPRLRCGGRKRKRK